MNVSGYISINSLSEGELENEQNKKKGRGGLNC
jgi:hypothetical protein